jgi:RNA polymerase sigma-70 factor, ECF subfamily
VKRALKVVVANGLGNQSVTNTLVFDPLTLLIAKAGKGDRSAAKTLVEKLSPKVWRIAWRFLRDSAEAEDVTQEALIRMWKVAPNWKPGKAKFETWLHQVTTNLCFDRLRKAGRFVDEEAAPEPLDPGPLPDADLVGVALRTRIDAALAALPDRQRAAIVLTHYEELSGKEAGDVLGISVDALESLLSRGRRALRIALAEEKHELLEAAVKGYVA